MKFIQKISFSQEVIIAPCKLKIDGKCGPETCEEKNPCKKDEICIDEKDGTRCEKKPSEIKPEQETLERSHRDKIAIVVKPLQRKKSDEKEKIEKTKKESEFSRLLEELNRKFKPTCEADTCFPGVLCTLKASGPSCGKCPIGYKGDGVSCERLTCDDSPCFPDVKCEMTKNGYYCNECPRGYVGDGVFCSPLTCMDRPCYPGVLCIDSSENSADDTVTCGVCPEGMKGDGYDCVPKNCEDVTCFTGVDCTDSATLGPICGSCPEGFEGDGIDCTEIVTGCALQPCFGNLSCFEEDGIVQCDACPDGMVGNGFDCKLISCNDAPCYPGVDCIPVDEGGFECGACPELMTGDGISCRFTTCADRPCFKGVTCMDISANLSDAYGESEYESYNDAYEIRQVETGFLCGHCPMGYDGDGIACSRVGCDPNPCWPSVGCEEDSNGAAQCDECPIGMRGDGWMCEPIKCSEWKCYEGVGCKDTPVGPKCGTCPTYFHGDGIDCTDGRTHCDDIHCFGKCHETDLGGVCDPCPDFFQGDGETCFDIREHCEVNILRLV